MMRSSGTNPSLLMLLMWVSTAPTTVTAQNATVAPTVSPLDIPECFSNLTKLGLAQATADPFVQKVWTLCPNTIFDIGFPFANGECCFIGQPPLVALENTRFQCGSDGLSSNNCTLRGGRSHFVSSRSAEETDNTNVQVAGMTFESANFFTAILDNAGDITFTDCVWKNHRNFGVVFVVYSFFPSRRRSLLKELTGNLKQDAETILKYTLLDQEDRRLVTATTDAQDRELQEERRRQVVVFDDNLFEGNAQGEEREISLQFGIINVRSGDNDITIRNSIFRNNLYGDEDFAREGYAISNLGGLNGSTMTIENNCFIDNDFIGFGPVQSYGNNSFTTAGNYGDGMDDDLLCQFAATSVFDRPLSPDNVTCVEFEAKVCSLEGGTSSPTSTAPTASPETQTTLAPSLADSAAASTMGRSNVVTTLVITTVALALVQCLH